MSGKEPVRAMYDEAIPPSLHALGRARHLLSRMVETGREDVLTARLTPDMFDCGTQLRTVGSFALRSTLALAGREWTLDAAGAGAAGLDEYLIETAALIEALPQAAFEGVAVRTIRHQAGQALLAQRGDEYLRLFALPNLWFHLSMAYAIARRAGLEIGKADFDGWHVYEAGFRFED